MDFTAWTNATADLPWGVQRALFETLGTVADGQVTLAHGIDSYQGHPCLINAVANMLALDVNEVNPASWFPNVVREFDNINRKFSGMGINKRDHIVEPIVGEVLMANFGKMKPPPTEDEYAAAARESLINAPYIEPSDAEFADMLTELDKAPAAIEVNDGVDVPRNDEARNPA
jgi:hypothetical protein